VIEFFVPGVPQPGGSKRAFYVKKIGRAVITDDNPKAKGWKELVSAAAYEAHGKAPLSGPLALEVIFRLTRPKGHFGSGKNADKVKAGAPPFPAVKPDCTKLLRSTEDALTGLLWNDDAQIVKQTVSKEYTDAAPGALVRVMSYPQPDERREADEQAEREREEALSS
jgi:Holliday junction resolvase RusA-like endonuclease